MDIKEVLKGLRAGTRQKVGLMTLIPLLSDTEVTRFGAPTNLLMSTRTYGTVQFTNPDDTEVIVPTHAAYLVKQAAQNHGMTHTGYLPKRGTVSYDTAACVQQSQGGTIQAGKHEFIILPYFLREAALQKRTEKSYSKLWANIGEFNKSVGLTSRGHLEDFISHFDKQMDEFVAEFEIVPQQVGAIILINGKVAGVERTPNYTFWKSVWKPLIRECYGSLAIQAGLSKTAFANRGNLDFGTPIDAKKVKSITDLQAELDAANAADDQKVKDLINNFIQTSFNVSTETPGRDVHIDTVEHDQFIGQVVRDGVAIVYASLTTKQTFVKNADWYSAPDFKM